MQEEKSQFIKIKDNAHALMPVFLFHVWSLSCGKSSWYLHTCDTLKSKELQFCQWTLIHYILRYQSLQCLLVLSFPFLLMNECLIPKCTVITGKFSYSDTVGKSSPWRDLKFPNSLNSLAVLLTLHLLEDWSKKKIG